MLHSSLNSHLIPDMISAPDLDLARKETLPPAGTETMARRERTRAAATASTRAYHEMDCPLSPNRSKTSEWVHFSQYRYPAYIHTQPISSLGIGHHIHIHTYIHIYTIQLQYVGNKGPILLTHSGDFSSHSKQKFNSSKDKSTVPIPVVRNTCEGTTDNNRLHKQLKIRDFTCTC